MEIPQGTSLSPKLFVLYIKAILQEINVLNPVTHIQVFIDDILCQSQNTSHVQAAFTWLIEKLKQKNLVINEKKCKFISDDPNDYLITDEGVRIETKKSAKYLGQ